MLALGLLFASASACSADLYNGADYRPLIADRRASLAGDIVTVLVYENSSARNSADTSTSTAFSVGGSVRSLANTDTSLQANLRDSYGGRGQIQRSGNLLAQISVLVVEHLPNDDLRIAGEQTIDINGEKTRIRLSGRIRPIDISQGNTVLSTRIADARIDYVGDGYITDRTRPGLIPRVLAWLGLW
ncbi:MAG: flagellar basal body L-ring protein FlgH [Pseudomonas sp.]|uniref:flagellar basal body L-ring protein FlgH n=1 Tax=Stenotrophomonas sp. TaxID=69392 RepID=UPI003D6D0164